MRLLVTGGTATFESHALPVLLARGHDIRVLTRRENPRLPYGVTAAQEVAGLPHIPAAPGL